jgi:DNA-binding NtrC family response regulator
MDSISEFLEDIDMCERPHILIIDDDKIVRELLNCMLGNMGYRAIAVESGMDGLEVMRLNDFRLVFLDLLMPYVDGAETFKYIRQVSPEMQVVIMTGDSQNRLMEQALSYKPFRVLDKPFENEEVERIMDSFEEESRK